MLPGSHVLCMKTVDVLLLLLLYPVEDGDAQIKHDQFDGQREVTFELEANVAAEVVSVYCLDVQEEGKANRDEENYSDGQDYL
jgi:hypothetical protein